MAPITEWKSFISGVFERAAPTYDNLGIDFFGPAGIDLAAAAQIRPGQRVLDVGCGRGASLVPAAMAVGTSGSVTGIDIAPAMVAYANDRLASLGLTQGSASLGDAGSPDLPDASLDAVLAGFVIFFLPDPAAAVRSYARLLRPGGMLVMTVKPEDIPAHAAIKSVVDDALAPFVVTEAAPPQAPLTEALKSRSVLTELLTGCGFTGVRFVDRAYPVMFDGPDHYWRWMWSHGMRSTLELIPAQRRSSARTAVVAALNGCVDGEGRIPCPMPVRFVVAERSGRRATA